MRYIGVLLLLALILAGCDQADPGTEPDPEPSLVDELPISSRAFEVGTAGFIPRHWPNPTDDDWNDLFDKLPDYGSLLGVPVGWNEQLTSDNIPEQVDLAYQVTAETDVTPYVALGFEPDVMTQEEADQYFEKHGEAFEEVAVAITQKYAPEVLILGIESNRFFEKSPEGFDDFVAVYRHTYDSVKSISPATQVATNFQFEYMRGAAPRSGQLHDPHFTLIDRFADKLDLITLTVYPWLDVDAPANIPDDYFAPLRAHSTQPLMITETGWPTQDFPDAAVTATDQAQVDYLLRLLEITKAETMHALIWVFPHDPNSGLAGGIFDHISLRTNEGTAKAAFAYWEALQSL